MNKKIRILALILAVIMLVGVLPLSLFAADDGAQPEALTAEEETSTLDYLATKATGSLYSQMAFADLLKKIDSTSVIIAEGAYSASKEGAQASFKQATTGATYVRAANPGINVKAQQPTLILKNGEVQLTDSVITTATGGASTDITYTLVPGAQASASSAADSYLENGKSVYVASFNLKAGDAYTATYIARLRIYVKETKTVYTNGVAETPIVSNSYAAVQSNLISYSASTGVLSVNDTAVGIFSGDEYTNFTAIYDHDTDDVYVYVNGVYFATYNNRLASAEAKSNYGKDHPDNRTSKNHRDIETVWTSGQDTEDTSDDNYTTYTYATQTAQIDVHYGTSSPFAGTHAYYGAVRGYYTTPETVFTVAEDKSYDVKSYIEANNTPANGVFKGTDGYYFYEDGVIQGGKTVTVEGYNLVLDSHTGKITNVYSEINYMNTVSAADVTAITGTVAKKTGIAYNSGMNNNSDLSSYVFLTNEDGSYKYITTEAGEQTLAAVLTETTLGSNGKSTTTTNIYNVTYLDGAYAIETVDGAKVVATINNTFGFAPIKDESGNNVTFTTTAKAVEGRAEVDKEVTVTVLAKAETALKETVERTNYVTSIGNSIYELTEKTRKSTTAKFYSSTKNLTLGTTSTIGGDFQIVSSTLSKTSGGKSMVFTLQLKAGEGLDEQTAEKITFGKLRFIRGTDGKTRETDENQILILKKYDDGKYHLESHGVDLGVFSKSEYTNIMFVFTPDGDNNGDGTIDCYNIEIYSNGVKVRDKAFYAPSYYTLDDNGVQTGANNRLLTANSPYIASSGVYFSNKTIMWSKPLMYMGNAHAYSYDGNSIPLPSGYVVDAADAYTGCVQFEDGTFGMYEANKLVADGVDEVPFTVLNAHNITLGEQIGLNFYVDVPAGAKAIFTVDGKTQTVNIDDCEDTENGKKLTALLSSIQMNSNVNLKVVDSNGEALAIVCNCGYYDSYNYTVREYAEYVVANKVGGDTAVDATKAMIAYGAYAERVFTGVANLATAQSVLSNYEKMSIQYGTVGTINKITEISSKTLVFADALTAEVNTTATATDITKVGAVQLVLNSALKIRIALNVTEAPSEIVGGTLYQDGDNYYVDITDITPDEYNDTKTVIVDGNVINISVLAVASEVVNGTLTTYDKDFVNLMKALYGYYYYTAVYSGTITA